VLVFAPLPGFVERLRGNLALNGVDWVDVRPVIVSDEPGEAEVFRGPPRNLGRSTTSAEEASPADGFASEGPVPKVRVADAVDAALWPRIRLVKVDTEGDELRTLRGLQPLLRGARAGAAVLVEVTPDELAARGGTPAEVFELMRDAGFAEAHVLPNLSHVNAYLDDAARGQEPLRAPPEGKADVLFIKG
jgi:FkbM family methyltransferase